MLAPEIKSGFANIDNAKIYYEVAGKGLPLVMIHAGVADSRQWNNEFTYFAQSYQVIRYDMRGHGKSEPVLVIVGAHDTACMLAAADYMTEKIQSARKAIIESAPAQYGSASRVPRSRQRLPGRPFDLNHYTLS